MSDLRKLFFTVFVFGVFFPWTAIASLTAGEIFDGITLEKLDFSEVVKNIPKGSVVLIGEQHGIKEAQQGQLDILNELRKHGHRVHVAMEFLDYTQQSAVDRYRTGEISQEEFLKSVKWGSTKFEYYRDQILFPLSSNSERTFAINSPRWLSAQVSQVGIASLPPESLALFPPQFQIGRESYRKRFEDLMSGHISSPEKIVRYFEAQSLWDDTMAWRIGEIPQSSEETIVVIVGQFHIEYGGGLPYQLHQRLPQRNIVTIEELVYWGDEKVPFENLAPSKEYGKMSDFLLILRGPE